MIFFGAPGGCQFVELALLKPHGAINREVTITAVPMSLDQVARILREGLRSEGMQSGNPSADPVLVEGCVHGGFLSGKW